jgi:hypothetical protein
MFDTVLFYKNKFNQENPDMKDEAAEEKAVEEAEKIFNTVPVACNGRQRLGDVNDVFRRALVALGQPSQRDRPRKNPRNGRGSSKKKIPVAETTKLQIHLVLYLANFQLRTQH